MKKGLCGFALSVMLMTGFGPTQVFAEDKDRKEKMRIIVVEKRDKSGGNETKQGRSGDRKPQQ